MKPFLSFIVAGSTITAIALAIDAPTRGAPGRSVEVSEALPLALPVQEYRRVPDWPQLPPDLTLGEVNGVDVDSHGHVFVFHRADRGFEPDAEDLLSEPVVLQLEAETGNPVQAWGAGTFRLPHGLTVDHEDNIWVTDVGLHQVFKFTHDGELLLSIGEPGVGGWDERHFNRPTDVAVLPDGSFYVSDGYVNSRVAAYDSSGNFRFEWGRFGDGPGEFENPHGIALVGTEELLVADRQNRRIQIFTLDGQFVREWTDAQDVGRVFSVSVGPGGTIYVGVREQDHDATSTGVILLEPDWSPLTRIGFSASGDAVFSSVHDVAVGQDGAVYVAETRERRISKFVPVR